MMTTTMMMMIVVSTASVVLLLLRWSYCAAKPDEWLLRIRRGRLITAGVGAVIWRRPGDVVVRFSSTVQRVKFLVEALSVERLAIQIEGFALWSVSPVRDDPFRAFTKLGLVDLERPPVELRSPKHLLTPGQHRAFKALLAAEVRQHAASVPLADIICDQGDLRDSLAQRLEDFADRQGIVIEQVELLEARPVDESVLADLSVGEERALREGAARARAEMAERLEQEKIESATRLARAEAEGRAERQAQEARAEVELEREQVRLLESRAALRRARLEHETVERLAAIDSTATVAAREREDDQVRALAAEHDDAELSRVRAERESAELTARLEVDRRELEARCESIRALAAAEGEKSPALRDAELTRFIAERHVEALAALPLSEARWVTIGPDTPLGGAAALAAAVTELLPRPSGSPEDDLN